MVLDQYIQRIEDKLHLLLKKMQLVQSENVLLKEEINTQRQEIVAQQKALTTLEDRLRLMKLADAAQGSPTTVSENDAFKKEIRGKINDYIKEIDRCIAMLNA
jgi:uncharacterized coiled-coil protein SlyX